MANVEITLDNYNALKARLDVLEKILDKKNEEVRKVQKEKEKLVLIIHTLTKNISLFDRVFKWKKIINDTRKIAFEQY